MGAGLFIFGLTLAGGAAASAWVNHLSPRARRNRALRERVVLDPLTAREPVRHVAPGVHYTTARFGPVIDVVIAERADGVVVIQVGAPLRKQFRPAREAVGDAVLEDIGVQRALARLSAELHVDWKRLGSSGVSVQGHLVGTADDVSPPGLARIEAAASALVGAVARHFGHDVVVTRPCPKCGGDLRENAGALQERVCASCGWRFLGPDAAREALWLPLGVSPGELKSAAEGAFAPNLCLGCDEPMRAVLLEDGIVEVCALCGSAGLDAGELEVLSGGRFEG